jgi:hypothetical protein
VVLLSLALNSAGYLVSPGWELWAVIEIMLWTGMLVEGWMHFIAFEQTANDTFGQVSNLLPQSARSAAPKQPGNNQTAQRSLDSIKQIKRVRNAKINVGRNIRFMFLFCHILVSCLLTYSPLWPANKISPGECQVRRV